MRTTFFTLAVIFIMASCTNQQTDIARKPIEVRSAQKKSTAEIKKELVDKGFQIFDYVDEETKDTVIMQQYFIAFLKSGPNRSQSKEVADSLQALHMAHLGKMYQLGYADISGPMGDDGELRGITIYNVPTFAMADSLANSDPMVKAGRLVIEVKPWWAGKGFPLR
ncbi:YciI family protein [Spongiivirga sp. MCCC 1A20706]|uniref:YciI family protein n=1 Tax=Spongiivirga sp. MCCC 1A20706 TaxID=3160963 RepID=UPI0039779FD9